MLVALRGCGMNMLLFPLQIWCGSPRDRRSGRWIQTRQQAKRPGVVPTRHRCQQQDRQPGVQRGWAAQWLLPHQRVLCVQTQLLRHPGRSLHTGVRVKQYCYDKTYCSYWPLLSFFQVTKVTHVDGDSSVRYSSETSFVVDKYEIL